MRQLLLLFFNLFVFVALCAAKEDKNPDVGTVIGIDLGTTYSWLVIYLFLAFTFYFVMIFI